jgi:mannose-6-phosphate isomerase-like protein (cupin superfamily)
MKALKLAALMNSRKTDSLRAAKSAESHLSFGAALAAFALLTIPLIAHDPLAQRIIHADPAKYTEHKAVHDGPGMMRYMPLMDAHTLDTNLFFLHRGVLLPKSGIGAHFHNQCEEMFVIFDGEAQFTIDGRTSTLKGPAGAPCRMGHSHAIYNASDKPVEWMNINVSAVKNVYDAFNLGDGRVDVQLDPIPVFMTMRLYRDLLKPMDNMDGGKGQIQYRRALGPTVFQQWWSYVDHVLLPPGTSLGPHLHAGLTEVFYVMNGEGTVRMAPYAPPLTVGVFLQNQGRGQEMASIRKGDAVPVQLSEVHSFENTGSEPLEMMVIGISSHPDKAIDTVQLRETAMVR